MTNARKWISALVACAGFVAMGKSQTVVAPDVDGGKTGKDAVQVHFAQLAPGWISDAVTMDEIWQPLALHGQNHYAFGGPVSGQLYASRSDPKSASYQAWLGVYTIAGGSQFFTSSSEDEQFHQLGKIAELDQQAWLAGMGDPAPKAQWQTAFRKSSIRIDGQTRPLFTADMDSHSDLNEGDTQMSKQLGMPPRQTWRGQLSPFHDVLLHCLYSFWYDQKHDLTIVVYGVSASFKTSDGATHDYGAVMNQTLQDMMAKVTLTFTAPQPQPK